MRLLILSPDAYSIFFPKTAFVFGGIEVETGYYARGLTADHGFEVTVITRDQGINIQRVDGVTVAPHPEFKGPGYWDRRRSLAGRIRYRIFGERQQSIEDFYASLHPDVAYLQGMAPWTLDFARFCRKSGIPFLFRVASDMDLGGEKPDDATMQQWAGFTLKEAREVIDTAACILVQTPVQMTLLQERFGRTGTMLFNPVASVKHSSKGSTKIYDVLWIGKSTPFKRPELLIELARLLPKRKLCMVLNKQDESLWEKIAETLPANVEFIERVPFHEIGDLFNCSQVFVSTSDSEGFANTFLQAAAHGVPVVSMNCDPNFMLSNHGGGVLTGPELASLCRSIESLMGDAALYSACSAAAQRYVRNHHDARLITDQFSNICRELFRSTIQQQQAS